MLLRGPSLRGKVYLYCGYEKEALSYDDDDDNTSVIELRNVSAPRYRSFFVVRAVSIHIRLGSRVYGQSTEGFRADMVELFDVLRTILEHHGMNQVNKKYCTVMIHLHLKQENPLLDDFIRYRQDWLNSDSKHSYIIHLMSNGNTSNFVSLVDSLATASASVGGGGISLLILNPSGDTRVDSSLSTRMVKAFHRSECSWRLYSRSAGSWEDTAFALFFELLCGAKSFAKRQRLILDFRMPSRDYIACVSKLGAENKKRVFTLAPVSGSKISSTIDYWHPVELSVLMHFMKRRVWMYVDVIRCTLLAPSWMDLKVEDSTFEKEFSDALSSTVCGLDELETEYNISFDLQHKEFGIGHRRRSLNRYFLTRLMWRNAGLSVGGCVHAVDGGRRRCSKDMSQNDCPYPSNQLLLKFPIIKTHAKLVFSVKYIMILRGCALVDKHMNRMGGSKKRKLYRYNQYLRHGCNELELEEFDNFRSTIESYMRLKTRYPLLAAMVGFLIPIPEIVY